MRVTLFCVGSLKTPWVKDGCDQYIDRLQIDVVELSASKEKDSDRQRVDECDRLLAKIEKVQGSVWVLDEIGKEFTSQEFADQLSQLGDRGESVTFVLGGAFGLDDRVRDKADRIFALSRMTLPHELCRVVFLEQLYRAQQIQKWTGYHH